MDMVSITCPRCGHTESYSHPEAIPERKDCLGCLAEELIKGGLLYRVKELLPEQPTTQAADPSREYEDEEDHELSDEFDPDEDWNG